MSENGSIHARRRSSATARKARSETRPSSHQTHNLDQQIQAIDVLARVHTSRAWELSASDIFALQRAAGNRAVGELLTRHVRARQVPARKTTAAPMIVQASLAVGSANDSYEREADRVAATVMHTSESSPAHIQRMPSQHEGDEWRQEKPLASSITPLIQRRETEEEDEDRHWGDILIQREGGGLASIDPTVERGITQARGSGQTLPVDLRGRMEQAFGADFGSVRVHMDGESDSLNRSLRSRAFTTGRDLFFKAGEYNPASKEGQKLIAHELTHVVQQTGGASRRNGLSIQRAPTNVIQRSIADAVMEDRKSWKMMSPKLKFAMIAGAPVLQTFAQAWDTGKAVATPVYKFLAGDNPGILRAIVSGLVATPGALVGSVLGLAMGFLRGVAQGIGNPLYSIGKRAANFSPSESIVGVYEAKPSHPKYRSPIDERNVNYNAETKTDLANYALLIGGTGTAVGKFIADKANVISQVGKATSFADFFSKSWSVITDTTPTASATGETLSWMGGVGSGAGAVASLIDAKKGYAEWRDKANIGAQQRIGFGKGLSATLSAAQQSATSAYHFGNLAQSGVAATAQVATGGLGIATGAVDVLRGGYSLFKAKQNVERLNRLKQDEALHADTRKAATQAASTQEMRKTTAKGTIAKGVLTAVGGGLLAASVATPIGWLLLTGGAIIGGVFALKKWWDKRQRKKEIAIRELGVEEERKEWEEDVKRVKSQHWFWSETGKAEREALGPDPLERELKRYGFKDPGHFYSNYINYMANHLYNRAKTDRHSLLVDANNQIAPRYSGRSGPLPKELTHARSKKDLEKALKNHGIFVPDGNSYLQIAELVESIGLKFDWQATPTQPTPEKIGKALDT